MRSEVPACRITGVMLCYYLKLYKTDRQFRSIRAFEITSTKTVKNIKGKHIFLNSFVDIWQVNLGGGGESTRLKFELNVRPIPWLLARNQTDQIGSDFRISGKIYFI